MVDIIIGFIIAALLGLSLRAILKQSKSGGCGGCSGCSGCPQDIKKSCKGC